MNHLCSLCIASALLKCSNFILHKDQGSEDWLHAGLSLLKAEIALIIQQ